MRFSHSFFYLFVVFYSSYGFSAVPMAQQLGQPLTISQNLQVDNLNISGIAFPFTFMALATDEGNALQILSSTDNHTWQNHSVIHLNNLPDELDIEALAWQKPYLYALGSHSAKRKKIKANKTQKENIKRLSQTSLEPARQALFRIELDSKAKVKSINVLSLQKILSANSVISPFIGIPSKENGIDLEGLTIDKKGRLLIGFRGPVLRGNIATILRIKLAKNAFTIPSSKGLYIETIGTGVRGMTHIPNTHDFLILTGAMGDQPLPYQVSIWDGKNALPSSNSNKTIKTLCKLPDLKGKAEGIHFIKQTKKKIEFLIVFDGLKNGQPTQFKCNL